MTRSYGSGSATEIASGVWRLRVRAGTDPLTGRPRRITETFRGNRKDAQRRLAALVQRHGTGAPTSSATFGRVLDDWLAVAPLAQSTRTRYEYALRHLPDRWRAVKVEAIDTRALEVLYAELARTGVGASSVRKLHTVLSAALTDAVRRRLIAVNPAHGARVPADTRRAPQAPGADVLSRLLAVCRHDSERVWLMLAAVTGARRSEVLAIRWGDVDLKAGTVSIAASLNPDGTLKATKTGTARTVALDATTVAVLADWRSACKVRALTVGAKIGPGCYVVSDEPDSSKPWRPALATTRFRWLAAKAGAPGMHLHDVRHVVVSTLLTSGVPVHEVSRWIGHSRPTVTLDVYAHVFADRSAGNAEIMRRALDG